jgi:uncharacterized protein (TIGR02246 family)
MRQLRVLSVPLALAFLLLSSSATSAASSPEAEVRAVLKTQSEAWSRGDLEAFSSVYADDATFLSPTGVTHGGREVLARYRKRYPDAAAMGKLTLEVIEARAFPEGAQAAGVSVAARWRLEYPKQPDKKKAEGLTLIVLKKIGGAWKIVQDASM